MFLLHCCLYVMFAMPSKSVRLDGLSVSMVDYVTQGKKKGRTRNRSPQCLLIVSMYQLPTLCHPSMTDPRQSMQMQSN